MPGKIIVIGSTNTDMVIKASKLPLPGETILGGQFFMFPGGKGANQAVAAARLGGKVTFVARIGNDVFGQQALSQLGQEGIDTRFIGIDEAHPSGVALIQVDDAGENTIAVAPGANGQLNPADIDKALFQETETEVALLQLEIPLATVVYAIQRLTERQKKIILNPAPAQPLADEILKHLFLITPNETEAEALTGIQVVDLNTAEKAADTLWQRGARQVVITLGAKGAFIRTEQISTLISAPVVQAIDTTAAGDVFNGALAVGIANGLPLETAVRFACQAAAISVTRMGAQASAPYLQEVNEAQNQFLNQ